MLLPSGEGYLSLKMKKLTVLTAAALLAASATRLALPARAQDPRGAVTPTGPEFVPGIPWRDLAGRTINAHGGGVLSFGGTYYWYGEHKLVGKGEKDLADGGVHCYASTNLYAWKDEGVVLPVRYDRPAEDLAYGCILERPKVLFVEQTRSFVLFFKYYPPGTGYGTGYVGVATAKLPTGPFRYQHKFLGANSAKGSGDFAIFRDADGAVYHLTVRKPDLAFCIGRLRDDCLLPAGDYQVIAGIPRATEAPAVIRRNGKYYLLGSGSTGYAPNTMRAFVADAITGPYRSIGNPCARVNPHTGLGPDKTFGGQITFVIPVHGRADALIAMFDLWKPERPSEGLYAWLPVTWADAKPTIQWRDHWDLSIFSLRVASG